MNDNATPDGIPERIGGAIGFVVSIVVCCMLLWAVIRPLVVVLVANVDGHILQRHLWLGSPHSVGQCNQYSLLNLVRQHLRWSKPDIGVNWTPYFASPLRW